MVADDKTDEEIVQDLDATYESRTKAQKRADVLTAFACRAIFGTRAQRERMASAAVVTFDLDYYAFSAWQLRESGKMAQNRLDAVGARDLLAELDSAVPYLKDYRDTMTHALDDKLDDVAWFGSFAAKPLPGGNVEYVIDARHAHHEALEDFFAGLMAVLGPLGSGLAEESITHALSGRAPTG